MRIKRLAILTATALIGAGMWTASDVRAIYSYYKVDTFDGAIDTGYWQQNGTLSAGGTLTGSGNGGALVAKNGPPTSPGEYEIVTLVRLTQSGGTYSHLIRASQDAKTSPSTGTYYSVEMVNPVVSPISCTATLVANRRSGGSVTTLVTAAVGCHDYVEMRTVYSNGKLNTFLDGTSVLLAIDSAITSGNPGLAVTGAPAANGFDLVRLGEKDTQAPQTISAQSIAVLPLSNEIDLQWTEPTDNPAGSGVGIPYYWVYRRLSGSSTWDFVGQPRTPELADRNVSPGTTYVYSITPMDYHWNVGAATEVTVTAAPAGSVDPRRTGIRPTGSYWGANGENIDTRSGNLNFTLPLITAQGRNGMAVGISLNYNSQNWRRYNGVTWKLGQDAGYGYGWRVLAGSVTPFWKNYYEMDHWVFTDNTGAEYRLDQQSSGVWTSKETYVTYDSNQNRLYFNDGSFWLMYTISQGNERDSGTRYPTVMEDSNGNQILLNYYSGVNAPVGGSSSRISEIEDVRAQLCCVPQKYRSYVFNYTTYSGETLPHLTGISSELTDGENYTFTYGAVTLKDPFTATSYGSARMLTDITKNGVNLKHTFAYGSNGAGELTRVTYPYLGYIDWAYRNFTYTGSRMLREVNQRWFVKVPGAAADLFQFSYDDSGDAGRSIHLWTKLTMTAATAERKWTFETNTASAYVGLATQLDVGANGASNPLNRSQYTWAVDPAGRPYVGTELTTVDPGQAYQICTKVTQVLDTYGNLTQRQVYGYGSCSGSLAVARTYDMVYYNVQSYLDRYIRNRLYSASVTPAGGSAQPIAFNTYDTFSLTSRTGLRQHDTANYGAGMNIRGNATGQWQYGGLSTTFNYDITGLTIVAQQGTRTVSATPAQNNAVPGTMTVNGNGSLQHTMNWNTFLGLTQDAGPNGATSSYSYDAYARPTQKWSPMGSLTQFAYDDAARQTRAVTSGRVVRTTMDGFGRPVKVETGTGGLTGSITVVSTVDTEYAACACTPMGKVKRVSQPYAPGGTVYWTTYNYDQLGRTTSVVLPSGMGTTGYVYEGNTVKVTDAASKWKKFTMAATGELVQVNEPNPLGGADYVTTYTYNGTGKLTGVSMPRPYGSGSYTQTRTFNYDANGWMTSEINPETGTRTYNYNGDGTLNYRIDAKNQKVAYEYDSYQRVTTIRRYPTSGGAEDTCQTKMYYDSNPFEGTVTTLFNPVNLAGRLAVTEYSICAPEPYSGTTITRTVKEMYSYTAAGLVERKRFQLLRPYVGLSWSNSDAADMQWSYDGEGRVVWMKYPSEKKWIGHTPVTTDGPTVNYQFDSMARMTGVTETLGGQTKTLISAMLYNAHGAMTR
ncbi:MAG: hypothetical protein R2762_21895 [Bryobacteraceae bacterium]